MHFILVSGTTGLIFHGTFGVEPLTRPAEGDRSRVKLFLLLSESLDSPVPRIMTRMSGLKDRWMDGRMDGHELFDFNLTEVIVQKSAGIILNEVLSLLYNIILILVFSFTNA